MSALRSACCQPNGDLTEKRTTGWKKTKKKQTPPLKACRADKPLSQDEPQVQPFLNQLFIWIGLDGPCDFPPSVSSHLCPCVCMWMVLAWYVSHFPVVNIAIHWQQSILCQKFFLVLREGTDQSWVVPWSEWSVIQGTQSHYSLFFYRFNPF